jgi:hypothetical protein
MGAMSTTQVRSLVAANQRAADDFCRLVREAGDTSRLTIGGQWTVRDTAAHVLGFLKFYTSFLDGQPSPAVRGEDLAVLNAAFFMVFGDTDAMVLASALETEAHRFCTRAAGLHDEDRRPWHLGLELAVPDLLALMGDELLMHGWDIAAVTGNRVSATDAAIPVIERIVTIWPSFLRRDLGNGVRFMLNVDELAPIVFAFGDNTMQLEPAPSTRPADCTTTGSAMNHLLWILGRANLADSELTVSGARPELAESFGFPSPAARS